jgi:hypothetical protein
MRELTGGELIEVSGAGEYGSKKSKSKKSKSKKSKSKKGGSKKSGSKKSKSKKGSSKKGSSFCDRRRPRHGYRAMVWDWYCGEGSYKW